MLKFSKDFFKDEIRCDFHVTSMMKRFWASEMEILAWIDSVCKEHGIRYIMCFGTLIGAVRHQGFVPWDDDIDIGMLREDYNRFVDVVSHELPNYLATTSLLPGAFPPKEMIFNVGNGRKLDTSPEFLKRFHGCPYATGVDVFVFDRIPENSEEFAYQDRLIRMLDRMLMLQWEVDDNTITDERLSEYKSIERAVKNELDYTFTKGESRSIQILRLLDLACSLCDDCGSKRVDSRELGLYCKERFISEDHFTDRIFVPFEGVMDVPIPRDYDKHLRSIYGDYMTPVKFASLHDYPMYKYQRIELYKEYQSRGWDIPQEFLEYDENEKLIVDPKTI